MPPTPLRVYLDAGVIIQGCFTPWGAAKALLILCTFKEHYTVVLADSIRQEVQAAVNKRVSAATSSRDAEEVVGAFQGWLAKVRLEGWRLPTEDEVERHFISILPVLRHQNDLISVVSAVQAKPDWILSTNRDHWGPELATRTGLQIATPAEFLKRLSAGPGSETPADESAPSAPNRSGYFAALAAYLRDQHPLFPPFGEIVMRMTQRAYNDPVVDQTIIELHSDGTFQPTYTTTVLLPARYDGFQIYIPEMGDRKDGDRVIARGPLVRVAPRVPFTVQRPVLETALHAALDVALNSPRDFARSPVYIDTAASGYSHALESFLDPPVEPGVRTDTAFQTAMQWVAGRRTGESRLCLISVHQNGAWTTQHLMPPPKQQTSGLLVPQSSGLQLFLPEWGDYRQDDRVSAQVSLVPVEAGVPFEQQQQTVADGLRGNLVKVLAAPSGV